MYRRLLRALLGFPSSFFFKLRNLSLPEQPISNPRLNYPLCSRLPSSAKGGDNLHALRFIENRRCFVRHRSLSVLRLRARRARPIAHSRHYQFQGFRDLQLFLVLILRNAVAEHHTLGSNHKPNPFINSMAIISQI